MFFLFFFPAMYTWIRCQGMCSPLLYEVRNNRDGVNVTDRKGFESSIYPVCSSSCSCSCIMKVCPRC